MSKKNETSSPALKRSWLQGFKSEFGKITWPTKQSLAKKSFVTMLASVILGLIIYGVDILIEFGLSFIIG